jgi:hypothetical protein
VQTLRNERLPLRISAEHRHGKAQQVGSATTI